MFILWFLIVILNCEYKDVKFYKIKSNQKSLQLPENGPHEEVREALHFRHQKRLERLERLLAADVAGRGDLETDWLALN